MRGVIQLLTALQQSSAVVGGGGGSTPATRSTRYSPEVAEGPPAGVASQGLVEFYEQL